jgi:hypothetical protein
VSCWGAVITHSERYSETALGGARLNHERIEAWTLEQAGVVFDAKAAPGALSLVKAAQYSFAPAWPIHNVSLARASLASVGGLSGLGSR